MALGAYIRDADDAGFLLRRCVHSPGAIAGCAGQQNYFSVPNPKSKPNMKNGKYERFGPILGPVGWKFIVFWDRGNRNRSNPTIIGTSQAPQYPCDGWVDNLEPTLLITVICFLIHAHNLTKTTTSMIVSLIAFKTKR